MDKIKIGVAAAIMTVMVGAPTSAAQFTFATFTFEQDDTPDTLGLIGNNANVGGAQFSSGNVTRITRSVGFNSTAGTANSGFTPEPGFDASKSLGRQGNAQQGLTQSDSTSCLFACAINMPNGNLGVSTRHGLDLSWTGSLGLANGAGDDFVIYESASTPTGDEGFMVRIGDSNGLFSDWRFEASDAFELYSDQSGNGSGATGTGFDILDFGFSGSEPITSIQIANLISADTLGVGGTVLFDGSGASHGFGSSSLDPDPLYVGVLNGLESTNAVPLPAAMPLFAGALGMLGLVGLRRRKVC